MKCKWIIIGLFLTSCDYASYHQSLGSTQGPSDGGLQGQCVDAGNTATTNNVVTYNKVLTDVFQPKCLRCHSGSGASAGIDLSSYRTAKPWAKQVQFAVDRGFMPPPPSSLDPVQKGLITDWVNAGAPDSVATGTNCTTTGSPGTSPNTNPLPPLSGDDIPILEPLMSMPPDSEITYDLVREKVFKLRCFACHSNAGGNADGLNLETYFNTIDEIKDIAEEVSDGSMPPASRPPLSQIERAVVLRWIQLGSPK